MSYDIDLDGPKCSRCGEEPGAPELPGPTYNLTPIFHLALTGAEPPSADKSEFAVVILGERTDGPRGLRVLSGMHAYETVEILRRGIERMKDPAMRERFLALEPPNKWGTLPDAIYVLEKLLSAAEECPAHVWRIR